MLHPKMELKEGLKEQRILLSKKLLRMGQEQMRRYLCRVIWIDSKKLYVVPRSQRVWAPADAFLTVEDPHMPTTGRNARAINYYVAVNAVLGPVCFLPVTGTTDLLQLGGYAYKVRRMLPALYTFSASA